MEGVKLLQVWEKNISGQILDEESVSEDEGDWTASWIAVLYRLGGRGN